MAGNQPVREPSHKYEKNAGFFPNQQYDLQIGIIRRFQLNYNNEQ